MNHEHRAGPHCTDRNGEYAATGFGDDVAVVLATMPGRQSAVGQVLLGSSAPVNQDFTLDAPASTDAGLAGAI
jgi:hypothetical protein